MLKKVAKIPIHSQYKELTVSRPGAVSVDQPGLYQDGNGNVANEDNHLYEDILLIGEEKCVEDWPEDQPELNPDWKLVCAKPEAQFSAAGKLRLRRMSLKDQETGEEDPDEDGKLKKGRKFKVPFVHRRSSKGLDESSEKKPETHTEGGEDCAHQDGMQQKKGKKFKINFLSRRGSKDKYSDEISCRDLQTPSRSSKGAELCDVSPEAERASFEAAGAELLSAQWNTMPCDNLGAKGTGEQRRRDTDGTEGRRSTTEQWDGWPLGENEEPSKEQEAKELTLLADRVQDGIHVFNGTFMAHTDALWQDVGALNAIADDIFSLNKKARNTIGTINSLRMAAGLETPATVVTIPAGGSGRVSPTSGSILDGSSNSAERNKVELVVDNYRAKMADVEWRLSSVREDIMKLQAHSERRSGWSHHKDWEVRRAIQISSAGTESISRAASVVAVVMEQLTSFFHSMDSFYSAKDARELRRSTKKELASKIQELAQHLQESLLEINSIREELLDAFGYI